MSDGEPVMVHEAGAAAEQLGLSPSGLRRVAAIYEAVHGELPRKQDTRARLYPAEALERLTTARRLVEAEVYRSIGEALEALVRGVPVNLTVELSDAAPVRSQAVPNEALGVLLGELRGLREENAEIRAELRALRSEVGELRRLPVASVTSPTDLLDPDEPAAVEVEGPFVRAARWLERRLRGGRG